MSWYCDTIANSGWQYILLALPLGGAYYYGQNQKRLAWILIGAWAVVQTIVSSSNLSCLGG
jgi:hypothetical protein